MPTAAPAQPIPVSNDTGTIPVSTLSAAGSLDDRLSRVETRLEFLHSYTAYPLTMEPGPTLSSFTNIILGGITVPYSSLRPILQLPDDRWDAWASGWLINASGQALLSIYYQKNDASTVVMGSTSFAASATYRKVMIGPYPVRGTYAATKGAPQNEAILSFGLMGNVSAGTATLPRWTLWIRQSPRRSA